MVTAQNMLIFLAGAKDLKPICCGNHAILTCDQEQERPKHVLSDAALSESSDVSQPGYHETCCAEQHEASATGRDIADAVFAAGWNTDRVISASGWNIDSVTSAKERAAAI